MRALLSVLLGLVLSGCFQIASTITVRPDGSATIEDRVELSGMGAAALMEAEETPFDKGALQARAAALGEGVTLVGVEEADGGYTALYAVADVRTLRFSSPDLDLGDNDDEKTLADEAMSVAFDFEPGTPSTLRIIVEDPGDEVSPEAPADTLTEAERADAARSLGMARALLGDARISVEVVVEGDIAETDADYVEGSTVTVYDVHFDALFDVIEEHPELMQRNEPPTREIMALIGERDGFQIQSPGTVAVRFE